MKVRFLKSHGVYRRGVVIDHQYPGAAKELLRRGVVELVNDAVEEKKQQRGKRK